MRQQVMNLFAIPRDVRDIIWAENRVMLRAERVRITTHFVKEVLRELSEMEFPAKSREVVIEGQKSLFIESYGISREGMGLIKKRGIIDDECENLMEIVGKTSTLFLNTIEDMANNVHYRLFGHKAYEAFISGDFENYMNNEEDLYDDDEDSYDVLATD